MIDLIGIEEISQKDNKIILRYKDEKTAYKAYLNSISNKEDTELLKDIF